PPCGSPASPGYRPTPGLGAVDSGYRLLIGCGDRAELLHQAKQVVVVPHLRDLAVDDAVHLEATDNRRLPGRRQPGKGPALNQMMGVVNDDPVTLADQGVDHDVLLGEGAEIDVHQGAEPGAAGRDVRDRGVDDEVVGRQRDHPGGIVGVEGIEQTADDGFVRFGRHGTHSSGAGSTYLAATPTPARRRMYRVRC